jgi:hypothetical protein
LGLRIATSGGIGDFGVRGSGQILQVKAAIGLHHHAGEEVAQQGFLHLHRQRLARLHVQCQTGQLQLFPAQQVFAGFHGGLLGGACAVHGLHIDIVQAGIALHLHRRPLPASA